MKLCRGSSIGAAHSEYRAKQHSHGDEHEQTNEHLLAFRLHHYPLFPAALCASGRSAVSICRESNSPEISGSTTGSRNWRPLGWVLVRISSVVPGATMSPLPIKSMRSAIKSALASSGVPTLLVMWTA